MSNTNYSKTSIIKQLKPFVFKYPQLFWLCIFFTVIISIIIPIRPYLVQLTIDFSTHKLNMLPWYIRFFSFGIHLNDVIACVIFLCVLQAITIFIEFFLRIAFSYCSNKLGQNVVYDLRLAVFNKILNFKISKFDKTPIGTFTTRTINDMVSIQEIFTEGLLSITGDVLNIIAVLAAMLYLDWKLTLIGLSSLPLFLYGTYLFKNAINISFKNVRAAVVKLNSFIQEHLSGMMVIQAFSKEKQINATFNIINHEHQTAQIKSVFAYALFIPFAEVVFSISLGLLIWYVIGFNGDIGELLAFILYLNLIFRPIRFIADKYNTLQMGIIAAERVFSLLHEDQESKNILENQQDIKLKGAIEFKNIWFAYNDENWVLKNINFTINAGETIAIIGQTGSGKSSLISIINGMYPYQKGDLLFDNISLKSIKMESLRKQIGVVSQDLFLFSTTIKENLIFENPDVSLEKIVTLAKALGVHDFIMNLPNNYDYQVKERGAGLSIGQKQIITVMRALVKDPKILILDEATASIDKKSEEHIQHVLEKVVKNRTTIIIAHRLSTIRAAHRIMVLDKGVIAEFGTHAQLMALNNLYSKYYTKQLIDEKQY